MHCNVGNVRPYYNLLEEVKLKLLLVYNSILNDSLFTKMTNSLFEPPFGEIEVKYAVILLDLEVTCAIIEFCSTLATSVAPPSDKFPHFLHN